LNKIGEDQFSRLLRVRIADIKAHAPGTQDSRILRCADLRALAAAEAMHCFSLKDLEINGREIMALGVPEGKQVGFVLDELLGLVISGDIPNNKSSLADKAIELVSHTKGE
jgi:tRNA nucleotidyltransferase (CCA-adding enzyme)